jgi:golgi apyrase
MGGASAQIAFEPTPKMYENHSNDLRRVSMRYQDGLQKDFYVFVTSFLGFGANQARARYVEKYFNDGELMDPCLNPGFSISEEGHQLNGTGKFNVCLEKVVPLLNKDMKCSELPCLFNGVHAPIEDFSNHHFIGVSELWYTTFQAYDLGGVYRYSNLLTAASKVCKTPWNDILGSIAKKEFPNVDSEERMRLHCFKTAYLLNLLHDGLGIPRASAVHADAGPLLESIDTLDEFSVSWTMGAMFLYASSTIPKQSTITGRTLTILGMFFTAASVVYYYRCLNKRKGFYAVVGSDRMDQVAISIDNPKSPKEWY